VTEGQKSACRVFLTLLYVSSIDDSAASTSRSSDSSTRRRHHAGLQYVEPDHVTLTYPVLLRRQLMPLGCSLRFSNLFYREKNESGKQLSPTKSASNKLTTLSRCQSLLRSKLRSLPQVSMCCSTGFWTIGSTCKECQTTTSPSRSIIRV
jgi:hypothetical protein